VKFHLHDLHFVIPIELFFAGSETYVPGGCVLGKGKKKRMKKAPLRDAWFLA
jgi:hypothetical protein